MLEETESDDSETESDDSRLMPGILDKHGQYDSADYWDQAESPEASPTASLDHASHSATQADSCAQQPQQIVPIAADMQSPSGTIHRLESAHKSVQHQEHVAQDSMMHLTWGCCWDANLLASSGF